MKRVKNILLYIVSISLSVIIISRPILHFKHLKKAEKAYESGCLKYANHDYTGAITDLSGAIELTSKVPGSYYSSITTQYKRNSRKIRIQNDSYLKRANAKYLIKDYEGALSDIRNCYFSLIEENKWEGALYICLKEYKEAIAAYNYTLTAFSMQNDHNVYKDEKAFTYYNRGIARYKLEDYEGAISDYTMVIKYNIKAVRAYFNRGRAMYSLKEYKGAINNFTKVIRFYPTYKEVYLLRGKAKEFNQEFNEAIADYGKAIKLDPNYAEAYYNRGLLKIKLGNKTSGRLDTCKAKNLVDESIKNSGQRAVDNRVKVADTQWDSFEPIFEYTDISKIPGYGDADIPDIISWAHQDLTLGYENYLNKDYKVAIENFSEAIQLLITPESYYYRGLTLIKLGMKKEGCLDLNNASALGFEKADEAIKKYCL